jgi:HEAT repeat protein
MLTTSTDGQQRYHGYWSLFRLGSITEAEIAQALSDADPHPRVAGLGILSETPIWTETQHTLVIGRLTDDNAFVRRAAADAMGLHPAIHQVKPLLAALSVCDQADTHLVYKLRQAIRDHIENDAVVAALPTLALPPADLALLANLATAAKTPAAAQLLLARLTTVRDDGETVKRQAQHAARYLASEALPELIRLLQSREDLSASDKANIFTAIKSAYGQRGIANDPTLLAWGGILATQQLANVDPQQVMWRASAVP